MSGTGDNIATIRIHQTDYTTTQVVDVSINSAEMIADAVVRKMRDERQKGKWILDKKSKRHLCSKCLSVASRDDYRREVLSDYCGVCGADLRGDQP